MINNLKIKKEFINNFSDNKSCKIQAEFIEINKYPSLEFIKYSARLIGLNYEDKISFDKVKNALISKLPEDYCYYKNKKNDILFYNQKSHSVEDINPNLLNLKDQNKTFGKRKLKIINLDSEDEIFENMNSIPQLSVTNTNNNKINKNDLINKPLNLNPILNLKENYKNKLNLKIKNDTKKTISNINTQKNIKLQPISKNNNNNIHNNPNNNLNSNKSDKILRNLLKKLTKLNDKLNIWAKKPKKKKKIPIILPSYTNILNNIKIIKASIMTIQNNNQTKNLEKWGKIIKKEKNCIDINDTLQINNFKTLKKYFKSLYKDYTKIKEIKLYEKYINFLKLKNKKIK